MLRVMKTPVLPTPALHKTDHQVNLVARDHSERRFFHIHVCEFCYAKVKLHSRSSCVLLIDSLPTVDRDGTVLAELLFCFMYLANEIDETLS